jgi:hypothetical protein
VIRKCALALSALALSALVLPLGAVATGTSSASGSVKPHTIVTFTGSITCAAVGTIKLNPPLTSTASKGAIAQTLTGSLSKCTGKVTQHGLTIAKGTVSSLTMLPKGTACGSLMVSTPKPTGTVRWTATTRAGTITPTRFTTTSGSFVLGPPITITYKSTQTGSFAGSGSATLVIKQSAGILSTECGSTGVGLLNITTGSKVS